MYDKNPSDDKQAASVLVECSIPPWASSPWPRPSGALFAGVFAANSSFFHRIPAHSRGANPPIARFAILAVGGDTGYEGPNCRFVTDPVLFQQADK